MKKSDVVQELVNVFPSWSKTRNDEQSLGFQILNAHAIPLERMEKQLRTLRDNQYLTTANLDEIDLTYKVQLGTDFLFDEDTTDPLFATPIAPTVSGQDNETWRTVVIADNNDIESFWYDSIPNRVTLSDVVSGEDHNLLSLNYTEAPVSGIWDHHIGGGDIFVEVTGGVEYLTMENNVVKRATVILKGETRKGTMEEETFVFAWDQKQKTQKEWKQIKTVHVFNMEDTVDVDIRSADFNNGPYISPWNLKYSPNRQKIDEFWDLGQVASVPTLDRIEYQTDEWQQLVLGFSTKDVKESWELLKDITNIVSGVDVTVSGVDMALQPYSDRVWVVTEDNTLYGYNLNEDLVSGVDLLRDSTPGAQVQFEFDKLDMVLYEEIKFEPWHARPLKEVLTYRIWYQQPDGEKFGLNNGAVVPFASDFYVTLVEGTPLVRTLENLITIPMTQRGEYLVVLEVTFSDNTQEEFRRIFRTKYKIPFVTIDLSSIVSDTILGIDFDADQKMWVKTANDYYKINLHTDIMLIDYLNKIIYFKEDYTEVTIDTND